MDRSHMQKEGLPDGSDDRLVLWFDVDNTLYPHSSKIAAAMSDRIHAYFISLGLSDDEASALHLKYYDYYGLALRGLVQHHDVDPLDFDQKCDCSIPLEQMIRPNPSLRKLFQDIDRTKARVWALTNAYVTHSRRVIRILDLEDQIEDIVYCDYKEKDFPCKPEAIYYINALKKAGLSDPSKCYFVDDRRSNVEAAKSLGWGHCVHYDEYKLGPIDYETTGEDDIVVIRDLEDLRKIWPEAFKKG